MSATDQCIVVDVPGRKRMFGNGYRGWRGFAPLDTTATAGLVGTETRTHTQTQKFRLVYAMNRA